MKLTPESISKIERFIADYLESGAKTVAEKHGLSAHSVRTMIFSLRAAGADFPRLIGAGKRKLEYVPAAELAEFRAWKAAQQANKAAQQANDTLSSIHP